MRVLILDSYYKEFITNSRKINPSLGNKKYQKQLDYMFSLFFGTADSYSYYLKKLGIVARDIIANDQTLQRQWAKEHGVYVSGTGIVSYIQSLPYLYRFLGKPKWMQEILLAQIEDFGPDILFLQDLTIFNPDVLRKLSKRYKLVGQIASSLPSESYLIEFDLILSSLPNVVAQLTSLKIKSRLFRIGFDPRIGKKVGSHKKVYDTVFVGSFSPYHRKGTKLLETIASEYPIDVWGIGRHFLSPFSPLRKRFHTQVWGLSMYKILAQAKIVINRHSDVSDEFANNMRMFEATGMGALLITEERKNLSELFVPGKEVVSYADSVDLIGKLRYYLDHEDERKNIAKAGQRKTLRQHTYKKRMEEFVELLKTVT